MTTLFHFSSDSVSNGHLDATGEAAYPDSSHTIPAEHAANRSQLVACFALTLSALSFTLPLRISIAEAAFALFVAAPIRAWRSQHSHADACAYREASESLQQLVDVGARGGALSPVVELVKPAWLHAARPFHSSKPETRT